MLARVRIPLLLSLVALAVIACASSGGAEGGAAGDLEMKLRRVEVKSATFEAVELRVIVAAVNKGGSPVTLSGGGVTVSLKGPGQELPEDADPDPSGIVDGSTHDGKAPTGTIEGGAEAELAIPVSLPLPQESAALERLLTWKLAMVAVSGTVETSSGTVTIAGDREVAVPVLPKVVLTSAQIASVDEGVGGVAFFDIGIDNPNAFEIEVDRFAFKIDVGGKEMKPLDEGHDETVPAASVASFEENLQISETTFGPDVKKLLKQPTVPYHVEAVLVVRGIERKSVFDGEMAFAR